MTPNDAAKAAVAQLKTSPGSGLLACWEMANSDKDGAEALVAAGACPVLLALSASDDAVGAWKVMARLAWWGHGGDFEVEPFVERAVAAVTKLDVVGAYAYYALRGYLGGSGSELKMQGFRERQMIVAGAGRAEVLSKCVAVSPPSTAALLLYLMKLIICRNNANCRAVFEAGLLDTVLHMIESEVGGPEVSYQGCLIASELVKFALQEKAHARARGSGLRACACAVKVATVYRTNSRVATSALFLMMALSKDPVCRRGLLSEGARESLASICRGGATIATPVIQRVMYDLGMTLRTKRVFLSPGDAETKYLQLKVRYDRLRAKFDGLKRRL